MFKKQPQIEVPPTQLDLNLIKLGWILVALNLVLALYYSFELPEKIPIHFNLMGKADNYGDKSFIWFAPIIGLAMYFIMNWASTKMKPWQYNYPIKITEKNAPKAYALSIRMMVVITFLVALLFFWITLHLIATVKGIESYTSWAFLPLIILTTVYPFYVIVKIMRVS